MNTPANLPSAPSSSPSASDRQTPTCRAKFGALICRVVIPLWLLAGAVFKLAERNPNLLPAPVKGAIFELHALLGIGTLQEFMGLSMRSIIAVEFVLAAAMIFLPRVSRAAALATLALFIAILGWLVWTKQDQCGCFGAAGPSPRVMLAIDSVLFVLAAVFGPARSCASAIGFVITSIIGAGLAFGLPEKAVSIDRDHAGDGAVERAAPPVATTSPNGESMSPPIVTQPAPNGESTPPIVTPPAPAAAAWPDVPAKPKGFYLPDFKKWPEQRLSAQPMMHMLRRPLPEGLDEGRWHVVFYRFDCDHCQEMLNKHFTGKLATKTLLVAIPDASPGAALSNRVTDAVKTQLLRGANGPDYVVGTPVVVTVVDGVVKGVCEDPAEDGACLRRTLDAK